MYIDHIIKRNAYQLVGLDCGHYLEIVRELLLSHYFPADGFSISDSVAIEKAGIILEEMSELHDRQGCIMNPNFEIYLTAKWLKERRNFHKQDVRELASMIGTGIYLWCCNHKSDEDDGIRLSPFLQRLVESKDWEYK